MRKKIQTKTNAPENIFKVFHFLAARLVGFAVIEECSGVCHGTGIDLQQNTPPLFKRSYILFS